MSNNKKFTQREIDEILKSHNLIAIEKYTNNRTRFICENNLTHYRYMIRIDALKNGDKPTLWGRANEKNFNYNIELFIKNNYKNIVYLGYKLISKSNKKQTLVFLKCECGNEFKVILTKMINGYYHKLLCDDCKHKLKIGGVRRPTIKNLEIIENNGFKILNKSSLLKETINLTTKVEVEDEFGFRGMMSAKGCKNTKHFATFSIKQNKKFYIHNVNLWLKNNGCNTICKEILNIENAKYICGCGEEIVISTSQFKGGKCRCDKCTNKYSSLEMKVINFLIENNIEYITQYKFKDCRDKMPLPFDFYLPRYNICIETDGKQHYHIECFGKNNNFEITKYHDNIKNNYCKNNNIRLIRIPYYEFKNNNWKTYLNDFVEV